MTFQRKAPKNRWITVLKETTPCSDCRQYFPACCMDFDHRPGTDKVDAVGRMVFTASVDMLEAEIDKCDIVCSNCHRIRTQDRRTSKREDILSAFSTNTGTQKELALRHDVSESMVSQLLLDAKGVKPRKQLTTEQHTEIRILRASGWTQKSVAERFGCSQSHVSLIVRNKRAIQ